MTTLKKESKGDEVKTLQTLLGITADGIFGNDTEAAVKAFQTAHGLTADGIVGNKTWAALQPPQTDELAITRLPITANLTRCHRTIRYIVVHYTAGASSAAGSARGVQKLFCKAKHQASADFVVDDAEIVQCNPDLPAYYCWAVGDGKGAYGVTNTNSVSIEMCSTLRKDTSSSKPNHEGWSLSLAVLKHTADLVRYLMKKYNVPKERVIRHYDASRKACPGVVGWNESTLYNTDGTKTTKKNNSSKWKEWWNAL